VTYLCFDCMNLEYVEMQGEFLDREICRTYFVMHMGFIPASCGYSEKNLALNQRAIDEVLLKA